MKNIFINAGHTGKGTGANGKFNEGLETIAFRNLLREKLEEKDIDCIMDDDDDKLMDVVNKINEKCNPEDICIDIHFNSAGREDAHGSEVLYPKEYTNTEIELAEDLLNATLVTLGTKTRGIKDETHSQYKTLAMLSKVKCNSVLIEICYCSNKEDAEAYMNNKEELAYAYAEVINQYYNM